MGAEEYFSKIRELVDQAERSQMDDIRRVAGLVADAVVEDRLVYIFGAGHSNLLACDTFVRAGGLANFQAMLDHGLDFGSGMRRQSGFERLPGYAEIVIQDYDIDSDDVIIVVSNSGRNPAPVGMALKAKERGATVVALTSLPHSKSVSSNDPSGKRLFEIADIVLNTGCVAGDALVKLEGLPPRVGPGSTVMGSLILNAVVVEAAKELLERGETPPVGFSGNLEEGREWNEKVFSKRQSFWGQMRHM